MKCSDAMWSCNLDMEEAELLTVKILVDPGVCGHISNPIYFETGGLNRVLHMEEVLESVV